ncbi:hypothetical protein KI387_029656, partial [Taxus chinensis]
MFQIVEGAKGSCPARLWVQRSSSFGGGDRCRWRRRNKEIECHMKRKGKRVFFVDVHPLCYAGNQPRPSAFIHWITLLFSPSLTNNDPVIAVVKIEDAEADDVVATLVDQVLQAGLKTVIASPDKDFKQLISENVQLVMPMPELGRWSFYTLKHYMAQYDCDPSADLSL